MSEWIPPIRPVRALYARQPINQATPVRRGRGGVRHVGPEHGATVATPDAPALTPFERHYRRAFPDLDRQAGSKGFLTPQDLEAMLWTSSHPVLVRTLRDYELACRDEDQSYLFEAESVGVRSVEHGWLGGRSGHDVKTPLASHLAELIHYYTEETRYAAFLEEYQDVFSDWEREGGGKGYLDRGDVQRLMADPLLSGDNAAALATLYEALRGGVGPGESLRFYAKDAHTVDPQGATLKSHYLFHRRFMLAAEWHQKRRVLGASTRTLFEGQVPDGRAVSQTGFSDCYFEASLAGLALSDADGVRQMIVPHRDGSFDVRFRGTAPVRVTAPTDVQIAVLANAGMDGMWATVIHKAWLEVPKGNLESLTGHPSRRVQMPVETNLLRSLLRLSNGVVVMGMGEGVDFQYYPRVAFDRDADTVVLRDEWAGASPGLRETTYALETLAPSLVSVEAEI